MKSPLPVPRPPQTALERRTVRVHYFSLWADGLEDAAEYLDSLPRRDLAARVSHPRDPELLKAARLDRDWDAENLRCFAALEHPALSFLPARIVGIKGLLALAVEPETEGREEKWLLLTAQKPEAVASVLGRILRMFAGRGGRVFYWAYDDASRKMPCFARELAPWLDVLVHDERPLSPEVESALPAGLVRHHAGWLANALPFAHPFLEAPEERIVFLSSRLGYSPERQRQVEFMTKRFKDRFVAIHDHSLAVAERAGLARFKVHLSPEGRMYTSREMRAAHTDRPFWAGCLGQVTVVEDSRHGGRLEALHAAGLIERYAHGDLEAMAAACERALATSGAERRRLYEHFNREGTIGGLAAPLIAAAAACRTRELATGRRQL